MPASRSFLRWCESVGRSSNSGTSSHTQTLPARLEHVDELEADRVAERLGHRGHPHGVLAFDVGVDDRFAARSPAGRLVLGSSPRATAIGKSKHIYLRLSM